MKIFITVPCFNEEDRLPVGQFKKCMMSQKDIHFVFVDDGSRDHTSVLLEDLKKSCPSQVQIIHLEKNRGKAQAVFRGMKDSFRESPDIVGFWDADLSTPLSAIADFLKIFREKPEIKWIFGARVQLLGRRIKRKSTRHYAGRVFATLASMILKIPVYDTQCGAKLFRFDQTCEAILNEKFKSRWIFDVEMIARLKKISNGKDLANRIIFEYPLKEWTHVPGSKISLFDSFGVLWDLFKIWLFLKVR